MYRRTTTYYSFIILIWLSIIRWYYHFGTKSRTLLYRLAHRISANYFTLLTIFNAVNLHNSLIFSIFAYRNKNIINKFKFYIMETIYLLICETEMISSISGESLDRTSTVYGAYKTMKKAEDNKAWYEKCRKETNEKFQYKDKVRFYIQENTLE